MCKLSNRNTKCSSKTEVCYFADRRPGDTDKDVLWLQIAVDDSMAVAIIESYKKLEGKLPSHGL